MAPNLHNDEVAVVEDLKLEKLSVPLVGPRKYSIKYEFVLLFVFWHLFGIYGLYLCFTSVKWATLLFHLVLHCAQNFGVTAGTHRLWAHRAYKAKLPLEILLMLLHTMSCQYASRRWARDHRIHHKYSDTDADPHNARRGFFFSHIGWLMVTKHPEVVKRGKTVDCSDLFNNPVLRFQDEYYLILVVVISFLLPTLIPMYFWNESALIAYSVTVTRVIIGLHFTFCVNSVAHVIGNKPYDKNILPSQSIPVCIVTMGESFHNFHHAFPFDYRTAELGNNYLNMTTLCIDFFAWVGWAYDRKAATEDMIVNRMKRTGDGTDLWGKKIEDFTSEEGIEEGSCHYGWGEDEDVEDSTAKVL